MSTQAIGSSSAVTPPDELAAIARVRQIQAMVQQVREGLDGITSSAGTGGQSFASALQSAGTAPTATAASLTSAGASGSSQYEGLITQAAQRNGLEPALLYGLIEQESGFDPTSQSSAGAMGLTQLMPGTASSLGVSNPYDPAESIEGGARYLAKLTSEFSGNTTDALAAYNAGPGAVSQYGGVPPYPETESYVSKVLANADAYRQSHPTGTTATMTGTLL
jgi:soluble lytic murein transglycosylase-like protein